MENVSCRMLWSLLYPMEFEGKTEAVAFKLEEAKMWSVREDKAEDGLIQCRFQEFALLNIEDARVGRVFNESLFSRNLKLKSPIKSLGGGSRLRISLIESICNLGGK